MKQVVIVESPTKANTINKYLGSGYKVLSSKGHVLDLPRKELGVKIEDGFEATFVTQNKKLVKQLRKEAQNGEQVFLATDNDREGEAIAYDLYQLLNGAKDKDKTNGKFKRIIFNEITQETILEAIDRPTQIDMNKVNAQRARRILDRLVGYLISPLLSKSISGSRFEGLSAGRVQSVALRFIVDRAIERDEFEPDEYWEITVQLKKAKGGQHFPLELKKVEGSKPNITSEEEAEQLQQELQQSTFHVSKVREKTKQRSPLPPFITSTLQRAASSVLNFSPRKTMSIAQQLYEGVELDAGVEGLITYMRTDSTRVSNKAQQTLRSYIQDRHGEKYLSDDVRYFQKQKGAQDAHEAIRPTEVRRTPPSIKKHLKKDQFKLYKLIWDRFVATQMANAEYIRTRIEVEAADCLFKTSASKCIFNGFLEVLQLKPLSDEDIQLPDDLQEGDDLNLHEVEPSQHFTKPPARYSEASLIKALEKGGVGRPSTYATITHTIQDRDYVVKDGGSFDPTLLGYITVKFLKEYFPETVQQELTAEMEAQLDKIMEGKTTKEEVLSNFYRPLREQLQTVEEILDSESNEFAIETDVSCPKCGSPMNIRYWEGRPYLSCSQWPECKETKNLPEDIDFTFKQGKVHVKEALRKREEEEKHLKNKKCEKCGSEMEIKNGRYGRFYACTNDDCDNTSSISTGVQCPSCGEGDLLERYSRKRKQTFYGCSNYPDCKFTVGKMPKKQCPQCDQGVLVKSNSSEE